MENDEDLEETYKTFKDLLVRMRKELKELQYRLKNCVPEGDEWKYPELYKNE